MDRAKLKQRLIGAAVLIAIAVIVIPFVLNFGHDREWWGRRGAVPPPPEQGFVTRVLPLEQWGQRAESDLQAGLAPLDTPPQPPGTHTVAPPSSAPPTDAAPPPSVAPSSKAASQPAAVAANGVHPPAASPRVNSAPPVVSPAPAKSPAVSASVPPPAAPAPSPLPSVASSATTGEAWVVQLGSFSNRKNADELQAFLSTKGFRAFVEHGAQSGDSVFRVRIGPEKDKGRAEALRERVAHETQLRAIVLHYP